MERMGLLLPLSAEEVEAWTSTLLRAATLLGMNRELVRPRHYQQVRETLAAMAYRIDCEVVRRAASHAALAGEGKRRCLGCREWTSETALFPDGEGDFCLDCYGQRRKARAEEPRLTTLPREWEG